MATETIGMKTKIIPKTPSSISLMTSLSQPLLDCNQFVEREQNSLKFVSKHIFCKKMHVKMSFAKWWPFFSRPECVNIKSGQRSHRKSHWDEMTTWSIMFYLYVTDIDNTFLRHNLSPQSNKSLQEFNNIEHFGRHSLRSPSLLYMQDSSHGWPVWMMILLFHITSWNNSDM